MTNETAIRSLRVVDSDTHIIEPPDLWTSRMSEGKWGDLIPHVRLESSQISYKTYMDGEEEPQAHTWFVKDKPLMKAGAAAMAGWHEHAPNHPLTLDEIDAQTADPVRRLKRMDEDGIHAQVLYPNIQMFVSAEYLGVEVEPEYALETVRAYNDYIAEEWIATAPDRYIGMATVPFWDLEATKTEIERCKSLGHKGIIFTQQPDNYGLPTLDDRHWDGLWAAAQDMNMPVNFHIGAGKLPAMGHPDNGPAANYALMSSSLYTTNIRTLGALVFSGICHRFPRLDFISVESGIGWIPFVLEAMDWQWQNCGVRKEHPEYDLLPSEYFKRQIYGCFWFEGGSARAAIDLLGPENFLYETDFPHPTSMSPGPASVARRPLDYIEAELGGLPEPTLAKLLHGNAARLYHLEEGAS